MPGNVEAWNEAAIYGQVSGYVSQWFKDYGAHVKAGRCSRDDRHAEPGRPIRVEQGELAAAQAHYKIADMTAKRYDALTTLAVTQQEKDNMDATAAADKAQVAAAQQNVDQYQAMIEFQENRRAIRRRS